MNAILSHFPHIIPQVAYLCIGHLGDFCIGQVSNLLLGQVTNSFGTCKKPPARLTQVAFLSWQTTACKAASSQVTYPLRSRGAHCAHQRPRLASRETISQSIERMPSSCKQVLSLGYSNRGGSSVNCRWISFLCVEVARLSHQTGEKYVFSKNSKTYLTTACGIPSERAET